jgi:hypothetical protein
MRGCLPDIDYPVHNKVIVVTDVAASVSATKTSIPHRIRRPIRQQKRVHDDIGLVSL